MTTNFTPGPWHVLRPSVTDNGCYKVSDAADSFVAVVHGFALKIDERTPGNASLIAASPRLLSALEDFLANCRCHICPPCGDCVEHGHMREIFKNGREAVKQALGEI